MEYTLDCTAGDLAAFALQLSPDLPRSVGVRVFFPHPPDVVREFPVAFGASRTSAGIGSLGLLLIVGRGSDRQYRSDRRDSHVLSMFVDEGDHHLCARSSSAFAKYAGASRRISSARFSSRFSFSSCFSRSRSAVVRPSRLPSSRSACRSHERKVSAVQPIFPVPSPVELFALALPGETSLPCPYRYPLKESGLRRTRGGSFRAG